MQASTAAPEASPPGGRPPTPPCAASPQLVDLFQEVSGGAGEGSAFGGDCGLRVPGLAGDERGAEVFFEAGDLVADGGAVEVQAAGGGGEGRLLHDGEGAAYPLFAAGTP